MVCMAWQLISKSGQQPGTRSMHYFRHRQKILHGTSPRAGNCMKGGKQAEDTFLRSSAFLPRYVHTFLRPCLHSCVLQSPHPHVSDLPSGHPDVPTFLRFHVCTVFCPSSLCRHELLPFALALFCCFRKFIHSYVLTFLRCWVRQVSRSSLLTFVLTVFRQSAFPYSGRPRSSARCGKQRSGRFPACCC